MRGGVSHRYLEVLSPAFGRLSSAVRRPSRNSMDLCPHRRRRSTPTKKPARRPQDPSRKNSPIYPRASRRKSPRLRPHLEKNPARERPPKIHGGPRQKDQTEERIRPEPSPQSEPRPRRSPKNDYPGRWWRKIPGGRLCLDKKPAREGPKDLCRAMAKRSTREKRRERRKEDRASSRSCARKILAAPSVPIGDRAEDHPREAPHKIEGEGGRRDEGVEVGSLRWRGPPNQGFHLTQRLRLWVSLVAPQARFG